MKVLAHLGDKGRIPTKPSCEFEGPSIVEASISLQVGTKRRETLHSLFDLGSGSGACVAVIFMFYQRSRVFLRENDQKISETIQKYNANWGLYNQTIIIYHHMVVRSHPAKT